MTRSRVRTRAVARQAAEQLGDDYTFTRDPKLAEERRKRRRERAKRAQEAGQRDRGLYWAACIAPDCNYQVMRLAGVGIDFPICHLHAAAVWEMVELRDQQRDPDMSDAVLAMKARRELLRADRDAAEAQEDAEWRADIKAGRILGHIYFVRVGDLVKVGWTSVLEKRLKQYGASAEVLCHYPGTRDDETYLHRQLRPALAKGREWYEDGDILGHFIAQALAKHGPPSATVYWTQPKPVVGSKHNKGVA